LLTANYIHFELDHLVGNIIFYLLCAFLIILLEGSRKRFLLMYFVILIAAPIPISIYTILVIPWSLIICGFSISVYCLFGYSIYLISSFVSLTSTMMKKKGFLTSLLAFSLVFFTLSLLIMISFLYQPFMQNGKIVHVPGHALSFMLGSLLPLSEKVLKRDKNYEIKGKIYKSC